MKKLIGFLFLLLLVAGAGVGYLYMRVNQPFRGFEGAEQFVEIPSGAGSVAIGDRLIAGGVIRDRATYRTAVWMTGKGRQLKAGEYRFDRAMTAFEVIDKIARGDVYVVHVTFREGLTMAEMAKIFEAEGLGQAAAFMQAAKDPALVREIDPSAKDLEGYLFPETYALPRRADAGRLVRQMVGAFQHAFPQEARDAGAAANLTPRQIVTLASIVEKETAKPEERPIVAAVYRNRLRIGMPLQCDPTVIYALQRAGVFTGNLRRDDLQFDSPYNTYRYPGLPPGPIASPGKASLEAAAHPADVDYVYFVSRNDGSHEFARTLDEHNRNVQKFQIQYFREKRLRERQEGAR
jgi:peptidoglycan lytic transglycosylase G